MSRPEVDVDDGPAFAAAVGSFVSDLGGGFMFSSQAKAFGKDNGLRGRQAYVLGRGSVLGDVDADVVTSAFGFWPADVVREAWDAGRAGSCRRRTTCAVARSAYGVRGRRTADLGGSGA